MADCPQWPRSAFGLVVCQGQTALNGRNPSPAPSSAKGFGLGQGQIALNGRNPPSASSSAKGRSTSLAAIRMRPRPRPKADCPQWMRSAVGLVAGQRQITVNRRDSRSTSSLAEGRSPSMATIRLRPRRRPKTDCPQWLRSTVGLVVGQGQIALNGRDPPSPSTAASRRVASN
jgi:hypothetical protein